MDVSNGIKFEPSITITNTHGEAGVPGTIHKIQDPRKCWASDLLLCPGNVLEISIPDLLEHHWKGRQDRV